MNKLKTLFTKENWSRFVRSDGSKSVLSSIISVLIGLLLGFIVMCLCVPFLKTADPFRGLGFLFKGPFSSTINPASQFGTMIFYSAPLIFTGLSVAIAYKTGLFNIGAPGQFLMGAMGSLLVALNIDTTGNRALGVLVWLLALAVGTLLGAIWSLIPGFLKALFGINEVIICIMTNWIAANIVTWTFSAFPNLVNAGDGKSGYLIKTAVTGNYTPNFGDWSYMDFSIILAIVAAVIVWVILNKTSLGYSLKACGYNKDAARYAGMNERKYIVISMAIAGALSAMGGALYYLNANIELKWDAVYQNLPDYGFNGIPVALLANCNPIGVIITSILIRWLYSAGTFLQRAGYNKYFADVIIAIIIYLAGFARFFNEQLTRYYKANDKRGSTFTVWLYRRFLNYIHMGKAKKVEASTENRIPQSEIKNEPKVEEVIKIDEKAEEAPLEMPVTKIETDEKKPSAPTKKKASPGVKKRVTKKKKEGEGR